MTLSSKRFNKFAFFFSLVVVLTCSFGSTAKAQTLPAQCNIGKSDPFYFVKTIFCPTNSSTGVTPPPSADTRTPIFSGLKNRDDSASITVVKDANIQNDPGGFKDFNVGAWIVMDPVKNLFAWWDVAYKQKNADVQEPSAWYWDYLTDNDKGGAVDNINNSNKDTGDNAKFLIRLQYTKKDGTIGVVYKEITGRLSDQDAHKADTNGEKRQVGFFDFTAKVDDPNKGVKFSNKKQWLVTHQQVRSYVTTPEIIPYGSKIEADLWFQGNDIDRDQVLGGDNVESKNVNWPSRHGLGVETVRQQVTDTTLSDKDFIADGSKILNSDYKKYLDNNVLTYNSKAYFKIGDTVSYTLPASLAASTQESLNAGTQGVVKQEASGGLPECGIISGSILGCVAQIIYGLIFKPISWIAALFGYLFDFFIGYSVSDESYRFAFVNTGWQLVRDIANIFFIIILVWTGFSTVFSIGGISMKKVVPTLVINALIINFSLFGTRVVIDLSNVVARVFYNQLGVCSTKDCSPDPTTGKVEYKRGIGGYWPLSEKIVSSFNPQTILSSSTLSSSGTETTASTTDKSAGTATSFGASTSASNGTINTGSLESGNNMSLSSSEYAGYFIIVTLIGAAIMFAIALMFWGVSFMFLGRVVGLYICMIFSPFAFLSRGKLPLISGIKELTWDSWVKELTSYAMLAPIFIFFLYIVYSFLQTDFLNEFGLTRSDHSFFENVLYITIPMLIIYTLIKQAAGIAKEYGGKIGNAVQNGVNGFVGGVGGIVGGGVGIAAGGAALLGRNVIGRGMTAIGSIKGKDGKTNADRWAANANNGFFNRQLNNFYNKSQTGSFDARNLGLGIKINGKEATLGGTFNKTMDTAGKDLGISMSDKFSKKLGVGQDKAGGIQKIDKARVEARQKKNDAKLDFSAVSDGSAGSTWSTYRDTKAQKAASEKWQDKIDEEPEIKNAPQQAVIKQQQEYQKQMEQQLQNTNLTPDQRSGMESRLANSKEVEQKAHLKLVELKNDIIERLKKDPSASAAFAAAKKKEEDRLAQYGPIKNKKAFEAAMRAEYAENLKANSLWMTEGERTPWGTMMAGSAGILSIVAPGLVGTISTAVGIDLAGGAIDQIGNIHLKAADATIKAAQKQTGTTAAKIQAKIDMYENTLKEAIKSIPGNEHLDADNIKIDDPQHDLKRAVATNVAKLETEIEKDEAIIKNPSSSDANKITARVANEERRASIKELREAIKERDIQKEKLEKYNNDEESKKKKEGGDEKPAEPKK